MIMCILFLLHTVNSRLPKVSNLTKAFNFSIGSTNHLSVIGPRGGGGVDSGQVVSGTGGAYDPIGI